jgi:hypothetical protein
MYLGPLWLPTGSTPLVVRNKIGEQHGNRRETPVPDAQEISDKMRLLIRNAQIMQKLTKSNEISEINAIWSAVLVSFDQVARPVQI